MKRTITFTVFFLAFLFLMIIYLAQNNFRVFSRKITKTSTKIISKDNPIITAENSKANEGLPISRNEKFVQNNREYKFEQLFKRNRINLFLRLSDSYCMDCIDSCINQVNKHIDVSKINLVILGKFSSRQSLNFFKKKLNNHKIYTNSNLPLAAESTLQPYFFVVNNKFVTTNYFFPIKEDPLATTNYLKSL